MRKSLNWEKGVKCSLFPKTKNKKYASKKQDTKEDICLSCKKPTCKKGICEYFKR